MPVSERQAERAAARKSRATSGGGLSATTSSADLTPTAAWSRRVRWIGGLIQAAFAAFWLVRGSVVIGGGVGDALIAVFGVTVIGVFVYAVAASAGAAPRPKSPEGRRIERGVTIATVLEFAAAIVLPVLVSSAGHSDWVLPSIAITIGPLLLWLDHRVDIPRYRPVGWALTVGTGDPCRGDVGDGTGGHHRHHRRAAPPRHRIRRLPRPRGSPTRRGARQGRRGCLLSLECSYE